MDDDLLPYASSDLEVRLERSGRGFVERVYENNIRVQEILIPARLV